MKINRQWISRRYEASAWFRLATMAIALVVANVGAWSLVTLMPDGGFLACTIMIAWVFAAAVFFTWLVTQAQPEDLQ